jgi:hypothetical protein
LFRLKNFNFQAKQTNPIDPSTPFRTCEFEVPLKISDPNDSLFKEFERLVLVNEESFSNL